jgi:uncharacterized protein (DUF1015 family)
MVLIQPFRGLRFNPAVVEDLALALSPPYDVISADERRALVERSPHNVVRVELPAADDGDPYQQAARTLQEWRDRAVLVQDEQPAFYLYEVGFTLGGEQRVRRSLVAALRLEPWESGQVLPHERTMSAPKEDRLRLLRATAANISPVWTLYRGAAPGLERAWAWASDRAPESSCQLEDGTSQRLWKLDDPALVAAIRDDFAALRLVIADGHHRYETALQYQQEASEADREAASFILAHLVPEDDPGLVILPIHRLVRDLGPIDQVELETELGADWHAEYYPVWEEAPPEQLKALLVQLQNQRQSERVIGLFGPDSSIFAILILRNKQVLEERAPEHSEAWRGLDVALLDEGLLKPLLARAAADREQAIAYEKDPYSALQAVLRGDYQLAIFLNPTRPEQVIAVAEAGERMPAKSTFFYPKPPTGLVIRPLR